MLKVGDLVGYAEVGSDGRLHKDLRSGYGIVQPCQSGASRCDRCRDDYRSVEQIHGVVEWHDESSDEVNFFDGRLVEHDAYAVPVSCHYATWFHMCQPFFAVRRWVTAVIWRWRLARRRRAR